MKCYLMALTYLVEVATAIQDVPTGSGDRPVTDVVIESVTVAEAE